MAENDDEVLRQILEVHDRIQQRRQAGAPEREAWISAARQLFVPSERDACLVCGKFKSISQAHHIIPLTTQYDRGFKYPDQEHVWLCPNHHAMAHIFILDDNRSLTAPAFQARGKTTSAVVLDLSHDEFDRMMDLMRRAGKAP